MLQNNYGQTSVRSLTSNKSCKTKCFAASLTQIDSNRSIICCCQLNMANMALKIGYLAYNFHGKIIFKGALGLDMFDMLVPREVCSTCIYLSKTWGRFSFIIRFKIQPSPNLPSPIDHVECLSFCHVDIFIHK